MAKFNEYPAKTIPKDADKFMLYSAEDSANKLIDYDKLADAVLDKLTSKQFTLDQGTKTLLSALNELNSNALRSIDVDYGDITIDHTGFTDLASKMPQTGTVCMATIKYYGNITPINAINVYATSSASYAFGAPNTTISRLIVRYWYTK